MSDWKDPDGKMELICIRCGLPGEKEYKKYYVQGGPAGVLYYCPRCKANHFHQTEKEN